MNHWESIVNIALCRYKLVSNHKYRHMYKSRKKRVHTDFPCCIPSVDLRHYCLVACTIERGKDIIKCKCNHGRELNSANKATKERKEFLLYFSKVNRKQKKREIFLLF